MSMRNSLDGTREPEGRKEYVRALIPIVQTIFLALFILSMLIGMSILWMVVIVAGMALSLLISRVYCGWVCPINTLFRLIGWIYFIMGIRRRRTPRIEHVASIKIGAVGVFLCCLVVFRILGIQIPVLVIMLVVGVAITLVYEERFFHTFCPFGIILGLISRRAQRGMRVDAGRCNGCSICTRVCPNGALNLEESGKARVTIGECLMCLGCSDACPKGAIVFGPPVDGTIPRTGTGRTIENLDSMRGMEGNSGNN